MSETRCKELHCERNTNDPSGKCSLHRKAVKKMYVAVATNEIDFQNEHGLEDPDSPYLQAALVFFAESDEAAKRWAKKLLFNEPTFVRQIGRVNVDVSRSKKHELSPIKDMNEFHFIDYNETDEGCCVSCDEKAKWLQSDESRATDRPLGDRRKNGRFEAET